MLTISLSNSYCDTPAECEFNITEMQCKDSNFSLCIESSTESSFSYWQLLNEASDILDERSVSNGESNFCFNFSNNQAGSTIIIRRWVNETVCADHIVQLPKCDICPDLALLSYEISTNDDNQGYNVEFDIDSKVLTEGEVLSINFGDGDENPYSAGELIAHEYADSGNYEVCLTMLSEASNEIPFTCCQLIDVSNNADPGDLCSFMVSVSKCIEEGKFLVCMIADNPTGHNEFIVINSVDNTELGRCMGAECCVEYEYERDLTRPWVNRFTVIHDPDLDGSLECALNFNIVPNCGGCPEEPIETEIDYTNCQSPLVRFTTPFPRSGGFYDGQWNDVFISFGDGEDIRVPSLWMPEQPVSHVYPGPGIYEYCITASLATGIEDQQTCCYELIIDSEQCCPEDLITKCQQNCDTLTLCINDHSFNNNLPFDINFGDGNGYMTTENYEFTVIYPDPGSYDVCVRFTKDNADGGEDAEKECCYPISYSKNCCNTAGFIFTQQELSRSCINPEFTIEPICAREGANKHTWYFSDGNVYEGAFPPSNYIFTDFVNTTGEVCVTHVVECCGETLSETICLPHLVGAYIGLPGEERFMTDILPLTMETIHDVCQQYSTDPSIPLLIDCILVNDRRSWFLDPNGEWNFANGAELRNEVSLRFVDHTLQSAVRLQRTMPSHVFSDCCVWEGITHRYLTFTNLESCEVYQANAAIHYRNRTSNAPPSLIVNDCLFEGVNFGIKSNRQHVNVAEFHGNRLVGFHEGESCSCGGVNAIDFRNIPAGYTEYFRPGEENEIKHFEQGFHFENSSLEAYDFFINSLNEYPNTGFYDNPSSNDAAVGIDFRWNNPGIGELTFDDFYFRDLNEGNDENAGNQAVDIFVTNGIVDVDANASTMGSIKTYNVGKGYEFNVEQSGKIAGIIRKNELRCDRSGILMIFRSNTSNSFDIKSNNILVDGASLSSSGIAVSSPWQSSDQDIHIVGNDIDTDDGGFDGNNIFINRTNGVLITENTIHPSSSHGVFLNQADQTIVACNDFFNDNHGIYVNQSTNSTIEDNVVNFAKHALSFHGADNSHSYIAGNEFIKSNYEEITYEATSITGKQEHNKYNSWLDVNLTPIPEVHHDGTYNIAERCLFYVPEGAAVPSEHRPIFSTAALEQEDLGAKDDSEACLQVVLLGGAGGPTANGDDEERVAMMSQLLESDMDEAGFTPAQRIAWEQQIYRFVVTHPAAINENTAVSNFVNQVQNEFVGQSITIDLLLDQVNQLWTEYYSTNQDAHSALRAQNDQLDSLSNLYAIGPDSLDAHIGSQMQSLLSSMDSIYQEIGIAEDLVRQSSDSLWSIIESVVDLLPTTLEYEIYEKFIYELAIKSHKNIDWSNSEVSLLREIAKTCFSIGGRAVYHARGIMWNDYLEYYGAEDCNNGSDRSSESMMPSNDIPHIAVSPNPSLYDVMLEWNPDVIGTTADMIVSDINGNIMLERFGYDSSRGKHHIRTTNWPSGIYIVEMRGSNRTLRTKMILQK